VNVFPNDEGVVKITLKRRGHAWKLIIVGHGDEPNQTVLKYSARCDSLAGAIEQLDQWRKGVIIV